MDKRGAMQSLVAFLPLVPVGDRFGETAFKIQSCKTKPTCRSIKQTWTLTASTSNVPDAGLIPKPGVTGTVCTNLFPVPLLGGYGWFLTVYKRDTAASVGPFVARFPDKNTIHFQFNPGQPESSSGKSDKHAVFRGIAAGNINVRNALKRFGAENTHHELRFFEKGGSQLFTNRRNELHILSSESDADIDASQDPAWNDISPTYRVVSQLPSFEVREIFHGGGVSPRKPARFEYFCMNLFPIFPLWRYSAFVCVWRQHRNTSPVAIDKHDTKMELRVFDPLELPEEIEAPNSIGKFAVKVFHGAVSDVIIANEHRSIIDAINASSSIEATSQSDFRVVVDNKPNTFTPSRRNEIWVPVR